MSLWNFNEHLVCISQTSNLFFSTFEYHSFRGYINICDYSPVVKILDRLSIIVGFYYVLNLFTAYISNFSPSNKWLWKKYIYTFKIQPSEFFFSNVGNSKFRLLIASNLRLSWIFSVTSCFVNIRYPISHNWYALYRLCLFLQ